MDGTTIHIIEKDNDDHAEHARGSLPGPGGSGGSVRAEEEQRPWTIRRGSHLAFSIKDVAATEHSLQVMLVTLVNGRSTNESRKWRITSHARVYSVSNEH